MDLKELAASKVADVEWWLKSGPGCVYEFYVMDTPARCYELQKEFLKLGIAVAWKFEKFACPCIQCDWTMRESSWATFRITRTENIRHCPSD